MARLPQPGGDNGSWGDILNDFLSQSHDSNGSLKSNSVGGAQLQNGSVNEASLTNAVQAKLNTQIPDATNSTKGGIQLAGDLGGTATHPTVSKTYTKSDVGLSNVDNTSDLNKPISTATQAVLDDKADTSTLAAKLNITDLDSQTANKISTNGSSTQTALSNVFTVGLDAVITKSGASSGQVPIYDAGEGKFKPGPAPVSGVNAAALATANRRLYSPRGKIVFIVDDAQATQRTLAAPKIEAVGGKMNFAITSSFIGLSGVQMTSADVTDLYNRGHQIMSHSTTHPNMTTQTAAQRTSEWDNSKIALESLTATGAITDFVMPENASNLTTQIEAYGRYSRVFTAQNAPTIFTPGNNGLHIGRNTWGTSTHSLFLEWIKRIAQTGETYVIYCHSVETAGVSGINQTMLDEAITLASSLGVQWTRADEALIAHQPLWDPCFNSNLGVFHNLVSKSTGSTVDVVTDSPPPGFPGTRSLRMLNPGDGLNRISLGGYTSLVQPGEEYTASVRVRQEKTSGTGGAQLFVRQWDEFGGNIGDVNNSVLSSANAPASTPWQQFTHAFVPDKRTRTLQIFLYQQSMVGTTWFTHAHLAPTRLGVLG